MVDFLVLGNGNAVICKDIFHLIKDRTVRLGVTLFCGKMPIFIDKYGEPATVNSCAWFTTLKHNRVNPFIELKKYDGSKYNKYENYDAINVDRTEDIPDYDGLIGVPISFLDKWNPEQFDIVGLGGGFNKGIYLEGVKKYPRLLIKKK